MDMYSRFLVSLVNWGTNNGISDAKFHTITESTNGIIRAVIEAPNGEMYRILFDGMYFLTHNMGMVT